VAPTAVPTTTRRLAPASHATLLKDLGIRAAAWGSGWLPPRIGQAMLGAIGVVHGVIGRRHLARAQRWAAHQSGRRTWPLILAVLANHARSLPFEEPYVRGSLDRVRRRFVLEGLGHLEAAQREGGTIVLGFHLGPSVDGLALRIFGHRITMVTLGQSPVGWPLRQAVWARFTGPGEDPFLLLPDDGPGRLAGLYRLHGLLQRGQTIYITADGPGSEAFRIDLPGRDMVIRAGWFALRRRTGATTLPVLVRRDGPRIVVTIHPPLPPPDPDPVVDRNACRAVLAQLLADYLGRYPEQCYRLAIFADEEDAGARPRGCPRPPDTRREVTGAPRRESQAAGRR
jgi:lauroyl/myristoyl acyltransferase